MMSSERPHPNQRAMAWRASPNSRVRRSVAFEELTLVALLLPLLIGAALVVLLRRGTGWTSPEIPLLGIVISCAAGLLYSIDSRRRERPIRAAIRLANTTLPGALAASAIALALIAALLTVNSQRPVLATSIWVMSIGLLLTHALILERPKLRAPTPIDAIALIGLLALAVLLRLPSLTALPSFVHSDEAQMGLYTRMAFDGAMPSVFSVTNWWSVPWLGPALDAPLLLFFSNGLTAIRLASVLTGILATAGLWFLGSELWSRRAGFVTALLFAVLAPSIHFSRDGVHYMQSIAALVWTVLCYTRATKRYSGAYAALTGVLIGLDMQLYYAARLAVLLVFAHAAIRALLERGLLRNWLRLMLWTALGLLVAFLPMVAYYLSHPLAFAQRTDAVFLFAGSPAVHGAIAHDYGASSWLEILGRQIQRVALGFLAIGDRSEQYGSQSSLLDPLTAALVPGACALALARVRQSSWLLCVLWAGITVVLGGIFTTYQPDAPRLLAALPAVCLLVGGLAHTVLDTAGATGLRDAKPILAIGLSSALIAIAISNTNTYLDSYPAQANGQPITLITDVARYLSAVPQGPPVILYDHREFYLGHWTIRLLAPQTHGSTVWTAVDLRNALAAAHGPFLLISVDQDGATLSSLMAPYPGVVPVRMPVHDARHWVVVYRYDGSGLV